MDKIEGVPSPIEDTENTIKLYDVKVGDKFYYVDRHGRWIDVAEVRKIDIFNGHQRIFVRTFITNRAGQVINKHTPQNPYHIWPEEGCCIQYLFRTREEAYQYLLDYVKEDMMRDIEDLKKQAKRHNIQLTPGTQFPQIQASNEHQD
jgi:hypothetical protein